MASSALATINFVNHIPHNVNPYVKVAHHMQALMNLPHLPPWLTSIQYCTIFLYIMVFMQAVKLLNTHVQAKHLTLVSFCRLGLVQVEFPVVMAIVHILYAPLVIFDIIFLELVNARYINDMSVEMIVFGCKFLLLEFSSWCFVWVCACQVASHFYASPPHNPSASLHQKHNRTLNPIVRWWANVSFLAVILISSFFVVYFYAIADIEYNSAKRILHAIVGELNSKARHFNPQTYSTLDILPLLTPALAVVPHAHLSAHFTRVGIICHLAVLILLTITYLPTLWVSFYRIYAESDLERRLCAPLEEIEGESRDRLSRTVSKTRSQRRTVVWQAIAWFSGTLSATLILVTQLSFMRGDNFLQDEKWIILTYVGLHLPFGFLCNIILFNLNGYALQKYPQDKFNSVREQSVRWEEDEQLATNAPSKGSSPPTLKIQEIYVSQENLPRPVGSLFVAMPTSTYKSDPRLDRSSRDFFVISPDGTLHHGKQSPHLDI
ncbi:uncharacterized protein MELLADRAFT_78313 [Melampsora larici-populina 98AG31]|uniref:Uncharacterized protein n=1 Tax=Melampsora larici-populina (strain 98AG31 / pathotype 3-4-7) TaxID=747676 RepID=F4RSX3_MELLP|nr:uncharacterized protein MELLADRAFT_78313 [Melampsora larici-populina 98AG31]EGG04529.1 hypothetical protein MELLADRAFT_78313 [Melampsora larici-populina 98AG31]